MLARCAGLLLLATSLAVADINMHNPRGSNNRQDEASIERRNANRLFDSQNNNRGGHNSGPFRGSMYYYVGSQLMITWANQHSCGDENNNCQVVIQYMCDESLRDGTIINTAPVICPKDCDTNPKFGHHESLNHYESCYLRERNKGLFTADQNLKNKNTAIFTRQNNAGTRRGFECSEEKDYYPYFGDSPWKDIAIMTNDPTVCDIVTENSQNVKSRWVCTFSDEDWDAMRGKIATEKRPKAVLFLDEASCQQSNFTLKGTTYQPIWKEIPSHGIPPPECVTEQFSRDNHQGNTIGGEYLSYKWTIPDIPADHCAIRIRYNISTNDYAYWTTDHTSNVDIRRGKYGPAEIYENYGFDGDNGNLLQEVRRRGYFLKTNPHVDVFDISRNPRHFRLRVAFATSQNARTFQDRSHSFAIRQRPEEVDDKAIIYNLNVRGKRGNIVQTYPTTEYDFVPTTLHATTNDYVHIQWTGSDNNPRLNNGQGRRGTDRSNIVQLGLRPYPEGKLGSNLTLGTNYPVELSCDQNLFGLGQKELARLALAGDYKVGETPGITLDNGDAYFDYGLLKTDAPGKHYFFSTRNNQFTNRDQKAALIVG